MIERLLEARERSALILKDCGFVKTELTLPLKVSRSEQHIEQVLDKSEELVESIIHKGHERRYIGEKYVVSYIVYTAK